MQEDANELALGAVGASAGAAAALPVTDTRHVARRRLLARRRGTDRALRSRPRSTTRRRGDLALEQLP
jgi:hypothetical protein